MRTAIVFFAAALSCMLLLSGCGPRGETAGPGTEYGQEAGNEEQAGNAENTDGQDGTPSLSNEADTGGGESTPQNTDKTESIPFSEDQMYAVAHLGYQQINDLGRYMEKYLSDREPPVHYISGGDYYLVIPRYSGMELKMYVNDIETSQQTLIFENPDCEPFIIQCNASDIFADVTIQLDHEGDSAEFSPFISLMDGHLDIGSRGIDITESGQIS